MLITESNRTDNDLPVKYNDIDCDLDDKLTGLTECNLDTDTEKEMNIPIIDLDNELNESAEQHLIWILKIMKEPCIQIR